MNESLKSYMKKYDMGGTPKQRGKGLRTGKFEVKIEVEVEGEIVIGEGEEVGIE